MDSVSHTSAAKAAVSALFSVIVLIHYHYLTFLRRDDIIKHQILPSLVTII